MKELVYEGYGCQIIRRGGKLFIEYDCGGAVSRLMEGEITEEEALKVQRGERDGYEVLLAIEKRGGERVSPYAYGDEDAADRINST